jgi:hypothetical protein
MMAGVYSDWSHLDFEAFQTQGDTSRAELACSEWHL